MLSTEARNTGLKKKKMCWFQETSVSDSENTKTCYKFPLADNPPPEMWPPTAGRACASAGGWGGEQWPTSLAGLKRAGGPCAADPRTWRTMSRQGAFAVVPPAAAAPLLSARMREAAVTDGGAILPYLLPFCE